MPAVLAAADQPDDDDADIIRRSNPLSRKCQTVDRHHDLDQLRHFIARPCLLLEQFQRE